MSPITEYENGYQEGYANGYEDGKRSVLAELEENQGDLDEGLFIPHDCIADISAYQKSVNFDELCAYTDFVILRARVCGKNDSMFEKRAQELNKRNMPFAVYDYARLNSHKDAKKQAEALYNLASPYNPRIYYIDTEKPADGVNYTDEMVFITTYVARLRELGVKVVGQYSGDWRYSTYYYKIADIFDTLWIAHYGKDSGELEEVNLKSAKKARHVDLRQYTSKGHIPGISTLGDLSVIIGDKPLEWFTGRKYV